MSDQTTVAVIFPLPNRDFDPSEVAVPWRVLRDAGISVRFATPDGGPAEADPYMISGEALDVWGWIPGLRRLKLVGLALRANASARAAYREMQADPSFRAPQSFASMAVADFDGMMLPGGHRKRGMAPYLEDALLQRFVAEFFDSGKPVGAVCHGVVLAARSVSAKTGKSVLHGRKTVALPWAMERKAWMLTKFIGRFWDPDYYRTYTEESGEPAGYRSVQAEVTRALASPNDFVDVPGDAPDHFRKSSGLFRDSEDDARPAWIVVDGNYVSGRWPGDIHVLARTLGDLVRKQAGAPAAR
ncbi:MAG: type 1 glutamine amidotransferase domain-containing protein [Pseudomonadota bacterium]